MRMKMAVSLAEARPAAQQDPDARSVRNDDARTLAELMLAAYRGTIDDSGETLDDAIGEVGRLLEGTYGTFDHEASELIERDGKAVAATLVTRHEGLPLIAFSMTAPEWKRRGLARAGLLRALERLRRRGESRVQLAVTCGNTPAETLYASLGFVAQPR